MEIEAVGRVSVCVKQRIRSWSIRVIKSFPLFNGEELAELGISESNSLVPWLVSERFLSARIGGCVPRMHTSFA